MNFSVISQQECDGAYSLARLPGLSIDTLFSLGSAEFQTDQEAGGGAGASGCEGGEAIHQEAAGLAGKLGRGGCGLFDALIAEGGNTVILSGKHQD